MKNSVIKQGFQNSMFVLSSQIINLILGVTKSLMLPVFLGIIDFGYWQVYVLFLSFAGAFAFGFNDGIYLRYGKHEYDTLPKKNIRTSILIFSTIQILVVIALLLFVKQEPNLNRRLAIMWAIFNIPIAGLAGVLIAVLQITNQLKKFSLFTIVDKALALIMIILLIMSGKSGFINIVYIDVFTSSVALLVMMFSCKSLLLGPISNLKTGFKELKDNVTVGINVMFAALLSMLVLTFSKVFVEQTQPIETYSIYAFAMSSMSLILVLVTSIGVVVYPTLSRLDEKRMSYYYKRISSTLNVLLVLSLIVYFPMIVFVERFMSKFMPIFAYLPIIFAMIILQAKMQIIVNPFYKILREEKRMLLYNIISVGMSVILVIVGYKITGNEVGVALGTFVSMYYRFKVMDRYLMTGFSEKQHLFNLEDVMIIVFLAIAYLRLGLLYSVALYIVVNFVYLLIKLKSEFPPKFKI